MYHSVGVFDALAVCSGVFFEDFHHSVVGFLVCPVSLEFEDGLEGGAGDCARLEHSLHRGVVGGL